MADAAALARADAAPRCSATRRLLRDAAQSARHGACGARAVTAMTTIRVRRPLTDHIAARLCPSWWFEESDMAGWDARFARLLAVLAPPHERRRRAG
jgi:hypothetical protein